MAVQDDNDLDILLKELKASNDLPNVPLEKHTEVPAEEDINDYILKKTASLVDSGIETLDAIRQFVNISDDAEKIESYARLIQSVNESINTINKINLQNKRAKASKEMKQMDIDARRQLPAGPNNVTNNNFLVATRDTIYKMLKEAETVKTNDAEIIDVESVESQ